MNKSQEYFLEECSKNHTVVASFIRLFNLWSRLSSEERREIIEYEKNSGRLVIKQ